MTKETRETTRRVILAAGLSLPLLFAGCGAPVSVRSHGYRARFTATGASPATYEIAFRGGSLRREDVSGKGPVLLVRQSDRKAFELDTAARTYREIPFAEPPSFVGEHPLATGWNDRFEATRRGVKEYHRESDGVFAGHACQVWRFDDHPGQDNSPTTTYWAAQDLDFLVVRLVRETRRPDGAVEKNVSELTNVRVNAEPGLFEVPKDYKKTG
jgi:hypothetical protein